MTVDSQIRQELRLIDIHEKSSEAGIKESSLSGDTLNFFCNDESSDDSQDDFDAEAILDSIVGGSPVLFVAETQKAGKSIVLHDQPAPATPPPAGLDGVSISSVLRWSMRSRSRTIDRIRGIAGTFGTPTKPPTASFPLPEGLSQIPIESILTAVCVEDQAAAATEVAPIDSTNKESVAPLRLFELSDDHPEPASFVSRKSQSTSSASSIPLTFSASQFVRKFEQKPPIALPVAAETLEDLDSILVPATQVQFKQEHCISETLKESRYSDYFDAAQLQPSTPANVEKILESVPLTGETVPPIPSQSDLFGSGALVTTCSSQFAHHETVILPCSFDEENDVEDNPFYPSESHQKKRQEEEEPASDHFESEQEFVEEGRQAHLIPQTSILVKRKTEGLSTAKRVKFSNSIPSDPESPSQKKDLETSGAIAENSATSMRSTAATPRRTSRGVTSGSAILASCPSIKKSLPSSSSGTDDQVERKIARSARNRRNSRLSIVSVSREEFKNGLFSSPNLKTAILKPVVYSTVQLLQTLGTPKKSSIEEMPEIKSGKVVRRQKDPPCKAVLERIQKSVKERNKTSSNNSIKEKKDTISPGIDTLAEHCLVWARWRLELFAPARLVKRTSSFRDNWQISFLHRTKTCKNPTRHPDEMVALGAIQSGDPIYLVEVQKSRGQRRMQKSDRCFGGWSDDNREVALFQDGSRAGLGQLAISRNTFNLMRGRLKEIVEEGKEECATIESPSPLQGLSFIVTVGSKEASLKKRICDQIGKFGGKICKNENDPKAIVIAPGTCRTTKYFLALMNGQLILHHDCILQMTHDWEAAKTRFNLSDGINRQRLFSEAPSIGLRGGTLQVRQQWQKIIELGGGTCTGGTSPALHVLVSSDQQGSVASRSPIPQVSVEWIIQSILGGKLEDHSLYLM